MKTTKKNQEIMLNLINMHYCVAVLLTNCHTWFYGSIISYYCYTKYPDIKDYLYWFFCFGSHLSYNQSVSAVQALLSSYFPFLLFLIFCFLLLVSIYTPLIPTLFYLFCTLFHFLTIVSDFSFLNTSQYYLFYSILVFLSLPI